MKYQLQPQQADFDKNGIAIIAGWALIYNIDAITGEYKNASYEYLPVGVGLPAYAFLDAPKKVDDEQAIVRTDKGWQYLADHRGKAIYSIETGAESTQVEVGNISEDYTLVRPDSEFDSWDGEKWVLDTEKEHQYYVSQAATEKAQLISEATAAINYLQDAVDAEMATNDEKTAFAEWKKYRVLLNRIELNNAPDIDWPVKPE